MTLINSSPAAFGQGLAPKEGGTPAANPFGRKYPPRIYTTVALSARPPVIDGLLNDRAWLEGEWSGGFTQQTPAEGAKPSQPTELKILYNEHYLYVAFRVHDDPALVHRYPGRRDVFSGDIIGICLDSYNGKRYGYEFDLTAGGSKLDLVLGNGETEWDYSWNPVWDGAVAHDSEGWTAEMRIPFSQLRYGPQEDQVWGMHVWRWIHRNQEESQWQLIPRQNTGRMHQLGELRGLRGLPRPKHVELLPHVLGRVGPDRGGLQGRDRSSSAGLDAKIGLAPNFTLDATVNPDFGQVEADPSVMNLTAYEVFYDEKRPFFLEGREILKFGLDGSDQLFYSRRIGHAPAYSPSLAEGESIRAPENSTILGAAKITGRTEGGLSVGFLQSVTARETARITSPGGRREEPVEPSGSYTVARIQKDWDKGNTSLGGMVTETHRSIADPELDFLPGNAISGGMDFTRHFANRSWLLEASAVMSEITGNRQAIRALQRNAVHYFQRPGTSHLGVDDNATSLSGQGGSVRFGSTEKSRLRLTDHLHWYSPGLDLNDTGYLRQADVVANETILGWQEVEPRGIFRAYSFQFARDDQWDFGGLKTLSANSAQGEATFRNKWTATAESAFQQTVDTRALRGGPALRMYNTFGIDGAIGSDSSKRVSFQVSGTTQHALGDDSRETGLSGLLRVRPSNRLSLSAQTSRSDLINNLQYVASVKTSAGDRWVLGRIEQGTTAFTMRADFAITPNMTVQYYGSPFFSNGRHTSLKRATDTLSADSQNRFHAYSADELAFQPGSNSYLVREGGLTYSFANPDFSFRQFRSNLVMRWEYKPGSTLYVVWSQGRTGYESRSEPAFSSNWDSLWSARPQNVFMVKFTYWLAP